MASTAIAKRATSAEFATEFPATNFLMESVNKEVQDIIKKSDQKLNSAILQRSEIMREMERIEAKINNMTEYVALRSRQRELQKKYKQMTSLIDSLGFAINENLTQSLDHVPGKTLTEKAAYLRGQ